VNNWMTAASFSRGVAALSSASSLGEQFRGGAQD